MKPVSILRHPPLLRHAPLVAMLIAAGTLAASAEPPAPPQTPSWPSTKPTERTWLERLQLDPSSPPARAHADQAKVRREAEQALRKLRHQHFGRIKAQGVRQEGLIKLREHAQPAVFPLFITVFEKEDADVRLAILDMFAAAKSDEGDCALAWVATLDTRAEFRQAAAERLAAGRTKERPTSDRVKFVIFEGLRSGKPEAMTASAKLAANLNLIDVMPWLISAQVTGQPVRQTASAGDNADRDDALAWIMVGQQTAFVSDLVPVVGPNAVAFDPQLSVVNTGVILRIIDAAVVTYHVDLHNELVRWSTREFGAATDGLGYDIDKWRRWYAQEFMPKIAEKARAEREAAGDSGAR
jgi:hypothetical protein